MQVFWCVFQETFNLHIWTNFLVAYSNCTYIRNIEITVYLVGSLNCRWPAPTPHFPVIVIVERNGTHNSIWQKFYTKNNDKRSPRGRTEVSSSKVVLKGLFKIPQNSKKMMNGGYYLISSYKALPRITPATLIIPVILTILCSKVLVFWEGHKKWRNLHHRFDTYYKMSNRRWRFRQFLWPS